VIPVRIPLKKYYFGLFKNDFDVQKYKLSPSRQREAPRGSEKPLAAARSPSRQRVRVRELGVYGVAINKIEMKQTRL